MPDVLPQAIPILIKKPETLLASNSIAGAAKLTHCLIRVFLELFNLKFTLR
jgi:hypothetical protein